jgi:hypothetical protein
MRSAAIIFTVILLPLAASAVIIGDGAAETKYWQLKERGAQYHNLGFVFPQEFERIRDGKKQYCLRVRSGAMLLQSADEACVLANYSCSETEGGDGPEEETDPI